MKAFVAELIGTFILVLLGTGSIILDEESILIIGNFGIAVVFGISVSLVIFFFGKLSGAHINPAVSISFYLDKKISFHKLIGYIIFQLIGALLASFLLFQLFPSNQNLGNTLPHLNLLNVFLLEFSLTFILMIGIYLIIKKESRALYQIALFIGTIIFFEAWLAGPYTGASMNPARSIAPSIFSNNLDFIWLYTLAPILGTIAAFLVKKKFILSN